MPLKPALSGMCFGGREHLDTGMRSQLVVYADGCFHGPGCLCVALVAFFEQFVLENAVDAFGDGILEWVALLAHADVRSAEQLYVPATVVLQPPVRVMYQRFPLWVRF